MADEVRRVLGVLGPNRRNLVALAAVLALLLGSHVVLPAVVDAETAARAQYATYLAAFSVWMAWFVLTGVAVWRAGEEGGP